MTAEDICWTTAAAACLPNALRQGASRAPCEKILGARHEAWRIFSGATANEKLCDLLLLPENAQQHACVSVAARPTDQRLFDRFEAL
jgi:hypothetical protein